MFRETPEQQEKRQKLYDERLNVVLEKVESLLDDCESYILEELNGEEQDYYRNNFRLKVELLDRGK